MDNFPEIETNDRGYLIGGSNPKGYLMFYIFIAIILIIILSK